MGCALRRPFPARTADAEQQQAVARALNWLEARQRPDGSWMGEGAGRSPTAVTGLALLAFLANDGTPDSARHGETVRKAIEFLAEKDWDGSRFRNSDAGGYAHGIATLALCEAWARTRNPKAKTAAEQAARRIVAGQQLDGGFNYGLDASTPRRDTCLSAWMISALAAARRAGLDVPGCAEALQRAAVAIEKNFDFQRQQFAYAVHYREDPRQPAAGLLSTTPAGVCALQAAGAGRSRAARAGAKSLRAIPADYTRTDGIRRHPLYCRFFTARALNAFDAGDRSGWRREMASSYVRAQASDGSWSAPESSTEKGYGEVYSTLFAALTLSGLP